MFKKFLCLLLAIMMLGVSGCKKNENENTENNNSVGRTLSVVGYNFEFENPLLVKNRLNRQIFSLIYDSLYTVDKTYEPYSNLILGENMTDRGTTWEFTIKPKIFFHDGTELSAADVAATVNFIKNNDSYYAYNVRNIQSIEALDQYKFKIVLTQPAQNIKAQLTFPIINAKDLVADFTMNGTGMYKLDNYIQRKKMVFAYNENHHANKEPQVKKIEIHLVPDKETANYAYLTGLADIYEQDLMENESASALSEDGYNYTEYLSNNYTFLGFNFNKVFFDDINVRQALNYAIDRNKIVSEILFEHGQSVCVPFNPSFYMYNKTVYTEYDMKKSIQLLEEGGWEANPNTGILEKKIGDEAVALKFNILVNIDNTFRIQVANMISESLKQLGIDAVVEAVPFDQYELRYINGEFDSILCGMYMGLDYDISSFIKSGENEFSYSNEMADLILYNIGISPYDSEDKKNYYFRLQEFFLEQLPHISLYYTKTDVLYSKKIKDGVNPDVFSIYNKIDEWTFR
ncbi:MAG: ABC transporter substrate-binding protein [Clostridia bacterium]|nr:ABC transporter substrate-binding protein [Clostridia bacterium]